MLGGRVIFAGARSGDAGGCDRCHSLGTACKYPPSVEESRAREESEELVSSRTRRHSGDSGFDEIATQNTSLYETTRSRLDSIDGTLSLDTGPSNGNDDDGIHASDNPRNGEEQILTDCCADIDYILDAGTHASNALHDPDLTTEASPQGVYEGRVARVGIADADSHLPRGFVAPPCFTADTDYTPWTDLSWATDTSYDAEGGELSAEPLEPPATSRFGNDVHYMLHDATFDACECLRTAAHVLHELSTHASLAGSPSKPSLDRHLEIFDSSTRRLHSIPHCTACRTRSENMMVNAMALQQLCIVCEQMSKVAESDSGNSTCSIDIRIGQFQVPVGSERAKIYATIVLSQLNIMKNLVKDFKMVSACMPTPFALLQSIENKIQKLCTIHHT
ncbi:hypothetical protein AMS68_000101 [Peltaster fructicola]|uniref:Uncharacterized protein n=1 Tax=Peltaster fructicola TaxID=286661 RepID=A0A6H0XIP5_9PEZI|nr:hypothetical protein AMS68_000101 [Peltaster fructicola]